MIIVTAKKGRTEGGCGVRKAIITGLATKKKVSKMSRENEQRKKGSVVGNNSRKPAQICAQ